MNDELLALAERVSKVPSYTADDFCGEIPILHRYGNSAVDENVTVILICAEFRDHIVTALRLAAQSPEPVTVKPLVWVDHRPDSFPEPAWSAQTPFGFYNIEEVSASDCPAYVVRLHAHRFVADKDSLDDAKAAAQADYEARIRSALVNAPAVDGALREALEPFAKDADNWADTVPDDHRSLCTEPGSQYPHPGSETIFTVGDLRRAKAVLAAASEAMKSDGGEERPASNPLSEVTHRPSDPHEPATVLTKGGEGPAYIGRPGDARNLYEDSARDTRPADVTVEVPIFEFDRYINGELMAEGVIIEKQPDVKSAMRAAARIASRGPNGETPVLVLNTYKIGAK